MPAPLPVAARWAIYVLTVTAWVAVTLAAFAPGFHLTDAQSRFALLVASVGTLKWIARRMMHPAHELLTIGKMLGRAEALAEHDESVVRLDDRRALRVVPEQRSTAE